MVRPQLSRALNTSVRYYANIATSAAEATGCLQAQPKVRQARLLLCCLDGDRVVSNDVNSCLRKF